MTIPEDIRVKARGAMSAWNFELVLDILENYYEAGELIDAGAYWKQEAEKAEAERDMLKAEIKQLREKFKV